MKYSTNEAKQSFQFNAHNLSINLVIQYYEFLSKLWIMNKDESIGLKRRSVSRVQMTFITSALVFWKWFATEDGKPFPDSIVTQIYGTVWHQWATVKLFRTEQFIYTDHFLRVYKYNPKCIMKISVKCADIRYSIGLLEFRNALADVLII